MSVEDLLICGASARAAAFSALRAGMVPHCADLFADVDLRQRGPVTRLAGRYPDGFRSFLTSAPPGPWMYTGGLENRPRWVQRWARRRPLWGNAGSALRLARSPEHVARILQRADMPAPTLYRPGEKKACSTRWLVKPRQGAGGSGISFFAAEKPARPNTYCQEYIEGQPCSLVYLGGGRNARLLGMTRQLVGVSFLHAAPFRYCGSIGPIDPGTIQRPSLSDLGELLVRECGLRGLFGVDGVVRENSFWLVEINPRYTASVEVLEHATGWQAIAGHAHVFMRDRLPPERERPAPGEDCVGKAILFAQADVVFPADGPWMKELRTPTPIDALPGFADIPTAGERIEAGRPILTFFARARTASACESILRQIAFDLDHWLYQR